MKLLSEKKAIVRLRSLISNFRSEISNFERRAKDCASCEVNGSCCLDAHFVNVHISRLEAVVINDAIDNMPDIRRRVVRARIDEAIARYALTSDGNTFDQTYSCPLFERGIGCLVHNVGKPTACIAHACYENAGDMPPNELESNVERAIDGLNDRVYGRTHRWLSIPLALTRYRTRRRMLYR
ncbi:MAG TPA: hypothetical protein VNA17_07210 [Pyrinomonadaceae bacterium]|nr:hypothetical protein [Pyrinomonadaceae bacterium]